MPERHFSHYLFAGGGTGGHIYPALAVADAMTRTRSGSSALFFCSHREIDARILAKSGYEYLPLPAVGLSKRPRQAIRFFAEFVKSYYFVKQVLEPYKRDAVMIGTGGFVAGPAVLAARALRIPVYVINVDSVPGKSNRFISRFAERIFVQFEQTERYFKPDRVEAVGCPLRKDFEQPDAAGIKDALGLDPDKRIVLVTGASSGSMNINQAMERILPELSGFADAWQIVHLTGYDHIETVRQASVGQEIGYHAVDYCDDMASLLAAADIVVGRAGAVSAAEYVAAGKPSICIPYPYHKDRHQYRNAQILADAGAAMIVDDHIGAPDRTGRDLLDALTSLMGDAPRRQAMGAAAKRLHQPLAAERILDRIASV